MNDNGITKERLLSYDRGIHSEPNFRRDQKQGLLRDLGNYMRTLKVVCVCVWGLNYVFLFQLVNAHDLKMLSASIQYFSFVIILTIVLI